MAILSVQSHVVYGHVGNRSAVFPLERLGYEVWPINTVQFSNHAGYASWPGEVFSVDHLSAVWKGLKERAVLGECEAVLSGYMGSAALGSFIIDAVADVKAANPRAVYCCDPVMGDYGRGFYVSVGIPELMRGKALAIADIVTPNQFEAESLSGLAIRSLEDAKHACEAIHAKGPSIVLITSFRPLGAAAGTISMFLSSSAGFKLITTPELPFSPPLNGAGDLTAALFLGQFLASRDPVAAFESMADSVYSVFEETLAAGSREIRLIAAQERIAKPQRRFPSRAV